MWVYSDRVLEWFYWLLNRVRTFQYRKSWRKNLPIFPFHLNLISFYFYDTLFLAGYNLAQKTVKSLDMDSDTKQR